MEGKMSKILVVDDESILAMGLEESLTAMGYEVVVASSGDEAIEKARALRPDLILMDITMPGKKDGIEAANEIMSEQDIPLIFLTAHSDPKLIKRAKWVEPVGYIVKPYKDGELRAAVEVALHKKDKDVIYKQMQKKKDSKLITTLRDQSEKLKELEARYGELKEKTFVNSKQKKPQGSLSDDKLSFLLEHLDLIILGILSIQPSRDIDYNYKSMSESEILKEIRSKFGFWIEQEVLRTSLNQLTKERILTKVSGTKDPEYAYI